MKNVEELLEQLRAQHNPEAERITRDVLAVILELHRDGLERLLALTTADERSKFSRDPRVAAMLLLHDLHPVPPEARLDAAVQELSSRFSSEISRLERARPGSSSELTLVPKPGACESTRARLRRECEHALLEAVPDLESLRVTLAEPAPALVQLRRGAAR